MELLHQLQKQPGRFGRKGFIPGELALGRYLDQNEFRIFGFPFPALIIRCKTLCNCNESGAGPGFKKALHKAGLEAKSAQDLWWPSASGKPTCSDKKVFAKGTEQGLTEKPDLWRNSFFGKPVCSSKNAFLMGTDEELTQRPQEGGARVAGPPDLNGSCWNGSMYSHLIFSSLEEWMNLSMDAALQHNETSLKCGDKSVVAAKAKAHAKPQSKAPPQAKPHTPRGAADKPEAQARAQARSKAQVQAKAQT